MAKTLSSEYRWPKSDLLIFGQVTRSHMPQPRSKFPCATTKTRHSCITKCIDTKKKKKEVTVLRRHGRPNSRDTSFH